MLPTKTLWTNKTFVLPGGGPENDLPVETGFNGGDPSESPVIRSCWALTDEERDWIKSGGMVELVIFGEGHPPVAMHVVDAEGNVLGTSGEVAEYRVPGDESIYAAAEQYRRIQAVCKTSSLARDGMEMIDSALAKAMEG